MSSPTHAQISDYHALNFFYDHDNSCALTALINNVRFHIIADASKVRKGRVGQEYARLLQAVSRRDRAVRSVGIVGDRSTAVRRQPDATRFHRLHQRLPVDRDGYGRTSFRSASVATGR